MVDPNRYPVAESRGGIDPGGIFGLPELKRKPAKKGKPMKAKINFDEYLAEQLRNKPFAERFKNARKVWDLGARLDSFPKEEAGLPPKKFLRGKEKAGEKGN